MAVFTGSGVALVTPFLEDGSVNYDKLDELIDFHCENGTDSLIICGTTGESSTLSEEEHMDVIKFAVERTKGRLPVIAGTGSNATYTTIDMSKEAVEDGADALLLVTPYYNKATQNGLVEHYKAVAKEAKAPIILYSVASRTGLNIAPETAAKLYREVDNIVAIKEASGNISQVAKIMNLTDLSSGNIHGGTYNYWAWRMKYASEKVNCPYAGVTLESTPCMVVPVFLTSAGKKRMSR